MYVWVKCITTLYPLHTQVIKLLALSFFFFCIVVVCACEDRAAMDALRDALSWSMTILLLPPENMETNPAEPPAETHIPGVTVHDLLASPGPFWKNNQHWSKIQDEASICLVPTTKRKTPKSFRVGKPQNKKIDLKISSRHQGSPLFTTRRPHEL